MGFTNRPPDIEAEITFLSTEQGGRQAPVTSGYRPNHDFALNGILNDALHEYLDCELVSPGQTARAQMWFLVPQYHEGRLYPGFRFTVQEGSRIVGYGTVTRIINPALQDSS